MARPAVFRVLRVALLVPKPKLTLILVFCFVFPSWLYTVNAVPVDIALSDVNIRSI